MIYNLCDMPNEKAKRHARVGIGVLIFKGKQVLVGKR